MKLEIKQPDQPTEPVAKLYLDQKCQNEISLMCEGPNGEHSSLAFFDMKDKTFHVFLPDLNRLGYKLTKK